MRIKIAIFIVCFCCSLYFGVTVFGGCPPTWTYSGQLFYCPDRAYETRTWTINWQNGNVTTETNFADGQCCASANCYPILAEPSSFPISVNRRAYEEWSQTSYDRRCNGSSCENNGNPRKVQDSQPCSIGGGNCLSVITTTNEEVIEFKHGDSADICSPCDPDPSEVFLCQQGGGVYDWSSCFCGQSPILIDVLGNGFNLTNYTNGVDFDITGDGNVERLAWTSANSDDAWLALDRNGNGTIDDGKELFGNSTTQPAPPQDGAKNGFLALAEFDKSANGGNNDGNITQQDAVFQNLKLWQDTNHNRTSEANELKTLTEIGLQKIELDYKESRRTDEHGNKFKYRAKVKDAQDAQLGRWAWDVYLAVQPRQN